MEARGDDFVLLGVALDGDTRFALLPEHHNPLRNALEPVVLVSDNQHETRFLLVGPVKDPKDEASTVEAQAAWVRNKRREMTKTEEQTDFVLLGVALDDDARFALLPELHNPQRNALQPVVLVSNNRRVREYNDFVLVGEVKDVPTHDSAEAQAAWIRNHRRAKREDLRAKKAATKTTAIGSTTRKRNQAPRRDRPARQVATQSIPAHPPAEGVPNVEPALPPSGNVRRKKEPKTSEKGPKNLEERRSNDSVMSVL